MNCKRGLRAGIFVFLILTGCSKDEKLNVEGAYSPVIVNLGSDNEPPVRGVVNALTAGISNPRGYPIVYHWSAGAGVLSDSTAATVHWTPPDSIGVYPVTVSIQAHDDLNNVDFFKTRTFLVHVDNAFERWTNSIAVKLDVVPPTAGKIYYAEIRNTSTGESDIWALATPLGIPEQITQNFWQATQPTVQSDGSRVIFLGRKLGTDGGASLWQVPGAGGDTATAALTVGWAASGGGNHFLGGPRFAPSGSMVAYASDTSASNFFHPKPWMRDAANMAVPPTPIAPTTLGIPGSSTEQSNDYWNPSWRGSGDSIVVESFTAFGTNVQQSRGLYKFASTGTPPANPEPFPQWLNDLTAAEPDWSPDGQYIVFARRVPIPGRTDRDLWIINANASDPSSAKQITSGIADEFHPRFSSDGSKVFFMSDRANGYGANGVFETERRGVNVWSVSRFDRP